MRENTGCRLSEGGVSELYAALCTYNCVMAGLFRAVENCGLAGVGDEEARKVCSFPSFRLLELSSSFTATGLHTTGFLCPSACMQFF